jgi:hypothetical protein
MVITKKYKLSLSNSLIILLVACFFLTSGSWFKAAAQDGVDSFQMSKLEIMMLDTLNSNRESYLCIDPTLARAAKIIGRMMIDNNFASQIEEIDFEQLLSGFGYAFNSVFRLDSAIISTNYLSAQKAVDLLYESMLEGNGDGFSSVYKEVGVSIIQSRISLKGRQVNVYVAVVIGADPDTDRYAVSDYMADQFEVLLNQFRANPVFVMNAMEYNTGMSPDDAVTTPLPPFRRGIAADNSVELEAFVDLDTMDTDQAVGRLFSLMVEKNINYLLTETQNMVSINIAYTPCYDDEEKFRIHFSVILKFNYLVQNMDKALIKGIAFKDDNENSIYDPGEGIHYLPLYIQGAGIHARTGFAGQFQAELKNGWYDILLFNVPQGEYSSYYDTYTMDRYVMFSVLE